MKTSLPILFKYGRQRLSAAKSAAEKTRSMLAWEAGTEVKNHHKAETLVSG